MATLRRRAESLTPEAWESFEQAAAPDECTVEVRDWNAGPASSVRTRTGEFPFPQLEVRVTAPGRVGFVAFGQV
jgi:hypothetical protein